MTDTIAPTRARPLFEITGFEFRLWPILLAALLMTPIGIPFSINRSNACAIQQ